MALLKRSSLDRAFPAGVAQLMAEFCSWSAWRQSTWAKWQAEEARGGTPSARAMRAGWAELPPQTHLFDVMEEVLWSQDVPDDRWPGIWPHPSVSEVPRLPSLVKEFQLHDFRGSHWEELQLRDLRQPPLFDALWSWSLRRSTEQG